MVSLCPGHLHRDGDRKTAEYCVSFSHIKYHLDSEPSHLVVTVVESMQLVELVFVEGFQISASSPTDKTRYSIRQTPTYASGVRPKYVEGYLRKNPVQPLKWSKQHNVADIWTLSRIEATINLEVENVKDP